jgi:hypothetical protein
VGTATDWSRRVRAQVRRVASAAAIAGIEGRQDGTSAHEEPQQLVAGLPLEEGDWQETRERHWEGEEERP